MGDHEEPIAHFETFYPALDVYIVRKNGVRRMLVWKAHEDSKGVLRVTGRMWSNTLGMWITDSIFHDIRVANRIMYDTKEAARLEYERRKARADAVRKKQTGGTNHDE